MGAGVGQSSGQGLAPLMSPKGVQEAGDMPLPSQQGDPSPAVLPTPTTTPGLGYPAGPLGTTPLTLHIMLTLLYFSVLGFTFSTKFFRLRMKKIFLAKFAFAFD